MLTPSELIRYQKQLKLPEWSIAKQHILKSSHVLVVGAGGLGVGALPYLAAVGLGHITIVDHDVARDRNMKMMKAAYGGAAAQKEQEELDEEGEEEEAKRPQSAAAAKRAMKGTSLNRKLRLAANFGMTLARER